MGCLTEILMPKPTLLPMLIRPLVVAAMAVCSTQSAQALVYAVNDTGAPVTDFHFTVESLQLGYTPPTSTPWGAGVAVDNGNNVFEVSYSGSPIAPNGKLIFPELTFSPPGMGTRNVYSNFTWTPGGQAATAVSVPEPAIFALMCAGLFGWVVTVRWQFRHPGAMSA